MNVYMTEEEQLQAIKNWWKRYQNPITIVLSVILLSIAGYRYWNWHTDKVSQQASVAYEQMMQALSHDEDKNTQSYANQLVRDFQHTVYADAAHLTLAKVFVKQENYAKAQQELAYVINHGKMPALKHVAGLRLARLYMAEKRYDKALTELTSLNNTSFVPIVNELKGDIFVAQKQYPEAMSAYQEALKNSQPGQINVYLQMKTNAVAALIQSKIEGTQHSQTV